MATRNGRTHVPLALVAPPLDENEREACWRRALDGEFGDAAAITSAFRLGPQRIERAATAARLAARHRGGPLERRRHPRRRPAAERGRPRNASPAGSSRVAGWSDLVVTPAVSAALREVTARVRHRALVLDGWQLRRGGGRGDGLTAMFSGPSGTGKTLAAEVIARELGVDLHTVDLATVVDKYIGETEKNLDRIFDEAEQVNTVLFFDEADALFGKRSEVRDARDRYANVEVAYLLQRMERFDGLAILATNLRLNIDDAFARRLDVTVDFPKPEGRRAAAAVGAPDRAAPPARRHRRPAVPRRVVRHRRWQHPQRGGHRRLPRRRRRSRRDDDRLRPRRRP